MIDGVPNSAMWTHLGPPFLLFLLGVRFLFLLCKREHAENSRLSSSTNCCLACKAAHRTETTFGTIIMVMLMILTLACLMGAVLWAAHILGIKFNGGFRG